ncbi:MAG TPA: alpha/beta hydrolase [Bryobacteraceae bacterium]|nr:alpha/beta hydrolase [Bryobacteraceae bacterium]
MPTLLNMTLKKSIKPSHLVKLAAIIAIAVSTLFAQETDAARWATLFANHYSFHPDIVYGTGNNIPLRLDVWERRHTNQPVPTVIYIHGGGWVFGDKAGADTLLMPYIQKGWNAVNVEYRMASQSLAPAAVQDTRCALRWVFRNATKYHFDTDRLVLTGHSAGGHLALITGLLTSDAGFDDYCPADPASDKPLHAAAIVNWYGITDVADLLSGPNRKTYAVMWLGGQPGSVDLARRLSPLTYVRAGLPPIITIHGDQDPTVPYSQAVRLHQALDKVKVPNELVTINGGHHGGFNDAQTEDAYKRIWSFLDDHVPGLK